MANQSVRRSQGLPCTDLCNCDSCENQSEGTSDDVFDEKEDEVEITKYELEYGSSGNDWTIDNDCLVWNYLILFHS